MTKQRLIIIGNGMAPDRQIGQAVASGPGKCGAKSHGDAVAGGRRMTALPRDAAAKGAHAANIDDIPTDGARRKMIGAMTAAAFRAADNRIFALEDKCPRKNGPHAQGVAHDGCVMRPLHNWVISLETGSALGADDGAAPTVPVRVEGRGIFLSLQSGA